MAVEAPPKPGETDKKAAPVSNRPFVVGTRRSERAPYDQTRSTIAGTQDLQTMEVDPNGFISGMYFVVEATCAGNAATVAFNADAPFNCLDSVTYLDVNSQPIVGPYNGWDLYIVGKWGGYTFQDDVKLSPSTYSVVTGAGATGGSFGFILRIPIEIRERDALGSLVNKNASAAYTVAIRLAATNTIYSTPPTNPPSIRVRIQQFGWMDPVKNDPQGRPVAQNPPAGQTTQYWVKQVYQVSAGALSQRLQGIDSLVRNLIFIGRDGAGSRVVGDANFPDPFTFQYENALPIQRIKKVWTHKTAQDWGYTNAVETAGGRDYGVFPETMAKDFFVKPGAESGLGYWPVSPATNLNMSGNIGGTGNQTITILVNKVVPGTGDPRDMTGV
jgi:hypothetical protein